MGGLFNFLSKVFLLTFLLGSNFAYATMVQFVGEPVSSIAANGYEVPIYREALVTLMDGSPPVRVYLTGAGIRRKKVLFFTEEVYIAASYTTNPDGIITPDPLESINRSLVDVVHITTVLDLTGTQIRTSFEDALDVNGVDLSNPTMQSVLEQVDRNLSAGSTETIIGVTLNGIFEHLLIEYTDRLISEIDTDLSFNLWRVWFGIPLDKEMANLKRDLIGHGREKESAVID